MSVTTINETDRRGFLLQMTAAGAAATAAASIPGRLSAAGETKSHDQAVQLKSRPDVIVYQRRGYQLKRQGTYPAWPWVARAGDGRLVCVFREGTRHNVNPAPRPPEVLMWTESSDEGRSWTPARVMVDPDGTAERNANVASLPDASLMVAYNVHTPDLSYRAAMAVFSHDGGASWTAPVVVHEGGGPAGLPSALLPATFCYLSTRTKGEVAVAVTVSLCVPATWARPGRPIRCRILTTYRAMNGVSQK